MFYKPTQKVTTTHLILGGSPVPGPTAPRHPSPDAFQDHSPALSLQTLTFTQKHFNSLMTFRIPDSARAPTEFLRRAKKNFKDLFRKQHFLPKNIF